MLQIFCRFSNILFSFTMDESEIVGLIFILNIRINDKGTQSPALQRVYCYSLKKTLAMDLLGIMQNSLSLLTSTRLEGLHLSILFLLVHLKESAPHGTHLGIYWFIITCDLGTLFKYSFLSWIKFQMMLGFCLRRVTAKALS